MANGSGDAAAPAGLRGAVASVAGEYAEARISVWWDIENCAVPRGCDAHRIAQNIKSALASVGYNGPVVDIKAYADTNKISQSVQQALSSTGVTLNHVPAGVKDASDKKILVDMIFWAVDNPPPASYLLISGDRDFSYALHRLRMKKYNILLAHAPNVSDALVAAAKVIWQWKDLVTGLPPLPGSPYTNHTSSNGSLVCAEKLGKSISDAGQIRQLNDTPTSTLHLANPKISSNGKDDNRPKWKEVMRFPNQGQEDSSSTRKPTTKQSSSGNQGGLNNNNPQANHGVEPNKAALSMTSNSVAQEVPHVSRGVPSVAPRSSPLELPTLGRHPLDEERSLREAPHQFFHANKLITSTRLLPGSNTPNSNSSMNIGIRLPHDHIPQYSCPLRPSDLLPFKPNTAPGNLSSSSQKLSSYVPSARPNGEPFTPHQSPPGGPPFPFIPPGSLTERPSGYHNVSYIHQNPNPNMTFVPGHQNDPHSAQILYYDHNQRPSVTNGMGSNMSSSGPWGMMGCTASHADDEGMIAKILNALCILKVEKLAPTEANISDCILYGEMNIRNFNIKRALQCAVQRQVVVMHTLGTNLPFFIIKDGTLWKCVNIMDGTARHPKSTWDAILKFLYSQAGFSSIMASQCKYHAATILKKSCLQNLVLGDILQILHVMIAVKKWIIPHSSGWQPLSLQLTGSDKNAKVGASTNTPNQPVRT